MINVFVVVLFIIALIGICIEKNIFNYLTVFNAIWGVIIFASQFALYEMRVVSDKVYYIIIWGCLFFDIGYIVYSLKPISFSINSSRKFFNKKNEKQITTKFFVFEVIITVLWIILSLRILSLLLDGIEYNQIRNIYSRKGDIDLLFSWRYTKTLWKLFVVPSVYVIMVEIISSLVIKRYSLKYYITAGILLGLYCFVTGSRIILLILILMFLFLLGYAKLNKIIEFNSVYKKYIKFCLIGAITAIILITVFRGKQTEQETFKDKMLPYYTYCTTVVPLMDYWIEYIDMNELPTHGLTVTNGIATLLKIFRVPLIDAAQDSIDNLTYISNTYIPVFGTRRYNAFLSVFFYFYRDFREFGVVVCSYIFGWISAYIFNQMKYKKTKYSFNVVLIFFIAIIKTFARFEFVQFDYLMIFVINWILYNLKEKKESLYETK